MEDIFRCRGRDLNTKVDIKFRIFPVDKKDNFIRKLLYLELYLQGNKI